MVIPKQELNSNAKVAQLKLSHSSLKRFIGIISEGNIRSKNLWGVIGQGNIKPCLFYRQWRFYGGPGGEVPPRNFLGPFIGPPLFLINCVDIRRGLASN